MNDSKQSREDYRKILSVFLVTGLVGTCFLLPTKSQAQGGFIATPQRPETEVKNDRGEPLTVDGTVIVGNQEPVDVVVRPTAVGYVLSTPEIIRVEGTDRKVETRFLLVPFVSYIAGLNVATTKFDPTSSCTVVVSYAEGSFLPSGQNTRAIATAKFGRTENRYIPLPDLLVGQNQQLEVFAEAFNASLGDVHCNFDVQVHLRRRPGVIAPQ